MKHLDDIAALVGTLMQSSRFHALVIESPPGWAKSTTIDKVMAGLGLSYSGLGSYSTPLSLYNALGKDPAAIVVLDDCAGVFGDPIATAILKAATWASSGTSGARRVSWRSSSDRVSTPQFDFTGKLILLSNTLRRDSETESFLSRTLCYRLSLGTEKVAEMLREAAVSNVFYDDINVASRVAEFLIAYLPRCNHEKVSLRTLQMGYEVARSNPENWMALLPNLLPKVSIPEVVVELNGRNLTVEDQAREFVRVTGLTRRNFFNHRRRLGLTAHAAGAQGNEESPSESFTGALVSAEGEIGAAG